MTTIRSRAHRHGTVHTDTTARADPSWDERRYWRDGVIVRSEWWRGQQCMAKGPVAPHILSHVVQNRDFCQDHGTQIYRDLGCQTCRQRPSAALA